MRRVNSLPAIVTHFSWWPVIDTNVIDAPFETVSSD